MASTFEKINAAGDFSSILKLPKRLLKLVISRGTDVFCTFPSDVNTSDKLIDEYFQKVTVQNVGNQTTVYQIKFCIEKYFYTINKLWTNLEEKLKTLLYDIVGNDFEITDYTL